jgi:hypothetical protein
LEPERSFSMYQRRTLALSDDERAELLDHRDHDPQNPTSVSAAPPCCASRPGTPPTAVANAGLLRNRDPDTVYAWLDYYRSEGLPGLLAHQHGGNRRGCF